MKSEMKKRKRVYNKMNEGEAKEKKA